MTPTPPSFVPLASPRRRMVPAQHGLASQHRNVFVCTRLDSIVARRPHHMHCRHPMRLIVASHALSLPRMAPSVLAPHHTHHRLSALTIAALRAYQHAPSPWRTPCTPGASYCPARAVVARTPYRLLVSGVASIGGAVSCTSRHPLPHPLPSLARSHIFAIRCQLSTFRLSRMPSTVSCPQAYPARSRARTAPTLPFRVRAPPLNWPRSSLPCCSSATSRPDGVSRPSAAVLRCPLAQTAPFAQPPPRPLRALPCRSLHTPPHLLRAPPSVHCDALSSRHAAPSCTVSPRPELSRARLAYRVPRALFVPSHTIAPPSQHHRTALSTPSLLRHMPSLLRPALPSLLGPTAPSLAHPCDALTHSRALRRRHFVAGDPAPPSHALALSPHMHVLPSHAPMALSRSSASACVALSALTWRLTPSPSPSPAISRTVTRTLSLVVTRRPPRHLHHRRHCPRRLAPHQRRYALQRDHIARQLRGLALVTAPRAPATLPNVAITYPRAVPVARPRAAASPSAAVVAAPSTPSLPAPSPPTP
ncbi:hypothetical protein DENSPDRAFT_886185 [Dentipellis sp. KUC8613]|nr:hypothetical protein DENSPDRAFT_886185 [Dentipellis sp. KUC8613]